MKTKLLTSFLFQKDIFSLTFFTPFEWTILTTILCTTVVLAMEEHLPNGDKTPLSISLVNLKTN